ncbi:MAG: S46 family peptidase, partial [Acidobacteriota bacterium]
MIARLTGRCFPWVWLGAVLIAAAAPATAEEGLWLPDQLEQLDWATLAGRGLKLGPDELRQLSRAVVKISMGGHGTGSFVSPEGLILTNHHVAHQCLATNSDIEENVLESGFVAPSRQAEIPCRGFELLRTLSMEDVTEKLQSSVDETLAPHERFKARQARRNQLATACQQDREDRRCSVVLFYGGAKEMLVREQLIRDVRLVHAPESAVGVFGGDTDNFEWPRHTGDYSFLRAWIGPDGSARTHAAKNVPYRPDTFLSLSINGYAEGSPVMVFGYPGMTQRYLPAAQLEYWTDSLAPGWLRWTEKIRRLYQKHAERDPSVELELIDAIRRMTNTEKYLRGLRAGLERLEPAAERRRQESELLTWIASDPARRQRYGDLLERIAGLTTQMRVSLPVRLLYGALRFNRAVFRAYGLYERSIEKTKPDDDRQDPYHDRQEELLRLRIVDDPEPVVYELDAELLAAFMLEAMELPEADRPRAVSSRLAGREGPAAGVSLAVAREILAGSKIHDPQVRARYFTMSRQDLVESGDSLIRFVADLYEQRRPFEDRIEKQIEAPAEELNRQYAAALMDWRGGALYPDANGTLRFSHGIVEGYVPAHGGSRRGYATTAGSMMATVTDAPDYRLRFEVAAQLSGRKPEMLVDLVLGD